MQTSLQLTFSTPMPRHAFDSASLEQDPGLAKAYSYIATIMQAGNKTHKEKIKLITAIFNNMMEASALQEQCMNELETENQILSEANDKSISEHQKLSDKMSQWVDQIDLLAKEKGLFRQGNDQLKRDLEALIKEKQVFVKTQNHLDEENALLTEKIEDLLEDESQVTSKQDRLEKAINDMENEVDQLLQESENQILLQETVEQELNHIQEKNQQMNSDLEELEFQKIKEGYVNQHDPVGYAVMGMWAAAGVIGSGGFAIPGIMAAGAAYGIFQLCKQHVKNRVESDLKSYADKHPEASKKEACRQVFHIKI